MNTDISTLLLGFILSPYIKLEIPKKMSEFYEKYKEEDIKNHLDEIVPFINDYYEKLKKDFELLDYIIK